MRPPTEEEIKAAKEALLRIIDGAPETITFEHAVEAVARSYVEGRDYRPASIVEQACTVSKHGKTVTIECDDFDEAQEMFDWLIDDEPAEEDSRP